MTGAAPAEKPPRGKGSRGYRSTPGVHATIDAMSGSHVQGVYADELEARRAAMDSDHPLKYLFIPWGSTVQQALMQAGGRQ